MILLSFTGCTAFENAKAKVQGRGVSNVTVESNDCPAPTFLQPDKIVFYEENTYDALVQFIQISESIYCSFPALHDEGIAEVLIKSHEQEKQSGIIMDRTSGFDNCDLACLPKEGNQYNKLLASGIDISIVDTTMKFCASNDGIYFFSGSFDERGVEESHIIFNEELGKIYSGFIKERLK